MMQTTEETLGRFIDRAKLLAKSSYMDAPASVKIDVNAKGGGEAEFPGGPDREQLEAFAIRLRFFIQNSEPTSLENIVKTLAGDPTVSSALRQDVEAVRNELNRVLDRQPPIRIMFEGEASPPTWREIVDVFVYGEIAHSNRAKRARYERWREHGPSFILLNYQLSRILTAIACEVVFIAELFERALQPVAPSLRPTSPPIKNVR